MDGACSQRHAPDASATYFWRVVSRDSHGATAGSPVWSFRPNGAPTVDAGADQTIYLLSTGPGVATLVGSASDDGRPSGSSLTVEWSLVSGPGDADLSDPFSATTTLTIQDEGTYVLRLTAGDSQLTTSDDVVLTFVRNQAPVVSAGAKRRIALPEDSLNLDGSVTDDGLPDVATLTIEWTKLSGPGTVSFAEPWSEDTQATFGEAGNYVLQLRADDTELETTDTVEVIVDPVNQPPVVYAGSDQVLTVAGNLIVNPGNEEEMVGGEIPGWTKLSGNWGPNPSPYAPPFEGSSFFWAGKVSDKVELRQDIDVSAFAGAIAAGEQRFEMRAYLWTYTPDTAHLIVEYRDAANATVLDAFDTGELDSHGVWRLINDIHLAPVGCGFIRIRLLSRRVAGTSNDGYFDALLLRAFPSPPFSVSTALEGTVTDDGLPFGSVLSSSWTQLSGPAAVSFADPAQPQTGAVFSAPGDYELQIAASDTEYTVTDTVIHAYLSRFPHLLPVLRFEAVPLGPGCNRDGCAL